MKFERLLVGITIVVILYLFTNAIFSFFTPGEQHELLRFSILGVPVAVLLFLFPRFSLVLLALFVYFVDWLALWVKIVPREFTWFIDLILIILLVRYLLLFPQHRRRPIPMPTKWIVGFLIFAVFSALINQISAMTAFIGLRVLMKYSLLFIVLYSMDFSEKFIKRLFYLLFAIALIQIPVAIIELKFFVPAKVMGLWDLITGTFGHNNTGILAVYLLEWIAFLVAIMVEQRRLRLRLLILILLLTIPPILGEAKAFFLVLVPLILFMLRREWIKRPTLALTIGVFTFLLFWGVDAILVKTGYWIAGRNPITYVTRMNEIIEKDLAGVQKQVGVEKPTEGRFYQMNNALRFATSSPQALLLGFGPGVGTFSFFAAYEAPTVKYYKAWEVSSASHSLAWILLEYGILGTLLFLVLPFLLYRRAAILHRSDREDYRILATAFQGLIFLYLADLFVTPVLQDDALGYFFWVTAAIVTQLSYTVETKPAPIPAVYTPESAPLVPERTPL